MKSVTKRALTRDDLQSVLDQAFGQNGRIRETTEFTDGWFAAVHGIVLEDGRELVLKAAPPADLRLLRYEVDLANTEIAFYRMAEAAGVPVPAMRYADPDGGYLITDRLRGESLHKIAERLSEEDLAGLRRQIGALLAKLHTVTGPWFGYPRRDGHTQSGSWRATFRTMMDDIVADALEYRRELPAPAEEIAGLVFRHADLLDEVTEPRLVHFDLWDGNIFVAPDPAGGYRIEGIIDGERAFFGDPVAELACLGGIEDQAMASQILEGYCGRPRELTASERMRHRMYTIYIDMIMLTEGAVRGFDPAEHADVHRWVYGRMEQNLARL